MTGLAAVALIVCVASGAWAVPVTFRFAAPAGTTRVCVAGTFNGWSTNATPLERATGGEWMVTLDLEPGAYEYKFVVNGSRWMADPGNPAVASPDGNSALWVAPPGEFNTRKRGDGRFMTYALRHRDDDVVRVSNTSVRFRLKTAQEDIEGVSLRALSPRRDHPMKRIDGDGLTETWSATVPLPKATKYVFVLRDGKAVLTVGQGMKASPPAPAFVYDPAKKPLARTPAWVRDTVWYQVFPERFCNGDVSNDFAPPKGIPVWTTPVESVERPNDHWWGGDLQGVIDKLPYLQEIGVTGIYLNPVFDGRNTHLYATDDYLKVAGFLGSNDTLKRLVSEAHRRGMRVMLDGVFNHTSIWFHAFQSLLKDQQASPYAAWYRVHSFPVANPETHYGGADGEDPPYDTWYGVKWMPELNTANPETAEYLLGVATHWLKETGADGWRLDVAAEVPHEFWRTFRRTVKTARPDAVIVGEIWETAEPWLQGDQFDATMNYPFRGIVLDFVARGRKDAAGFAQALQSLLDRYPPQVSAAMFNLLGSHDTPRLLTECGGDSRKAALAVAFQMCWPGAPSVYYGDEVGMKGAGDPWNRGPMVWNEKEWDPVISGATRRAINLRNRHPALRGDAVQTLYAPRGGSVAAFLRRGGGETAMLAVNASDTPQSLGLRVPASIKASRWRDAWNGTDLAVSGGKLSLRLPAWGVSVAFPAAPQGADRETTAVAGESRR
jgi:glycosidase